jgi:hypothetical protein
MDLATTNTIFIIFVNNYKINCKKYFFFFWYRQVRTKDFLSFFFEKGKLQKDLKKIKKKKKKKKRRCSVFGSRFIKLVSWN